MEPNQLRKGLEEIDFGGNDGGIEDEEDQSVVVHNGKRYNRI
jgi:hypothetical protein